MSRLEKAPLGWTPWDAYDNRDDGTNIMDAVFNGMPASEFYRAQLYPELFPHQKRMLLENWSVDDLQMYVCAGAGYADWEVELIGINEKVKSERN